MCGIGLEIGPQDDATSLVDYNQLQLRGPDQSHCIALQCPNPWYAVMYGAVLHLRGPELIPQPVVDDHHNVLCYNGEVFGGNTAHAMTSTDSNDTEAIMRELEKAQGDADAITHVFCHIHGPFAFIYFHAATNSIYFGHDRFGRRSLVSHVCHTTNLLYGVATGDRSSAPWDYNTRLCLSSVSSATPCCPSTFEEVPPSGIFQLTFQEQEMKLGYRSYPLIPPAVDRTRFSDLDVAMNALLTALDHSVRVRVKSIPYVETSKDTSPVAVFFSGGLDSVVLAALTHTHVRSNEPIDLINICFDAASNFHSPDRKAAIASYHELCQLYPDRRWRFICVDEVYNHVQQHQKTIQRLLYPSDTHMDLNIGAAFWFLARGRGHLYESQDNVVEKEDTSVHNDSLFGFKPFDGNVVDDPRECPAIGCSRKYKDGCCYDVCKVCCGYLRRQLTKLHASNLDPRAAASLETKLVDIGFACSLDRLHHFLNSFPSVPVCPVHETHVPPPKAVEMPVSVPTFETKARVVLVGIGADEQLAGYGRHRTALEEGGEAKLRSELAKDLGRIWKRNLGRDDRCIAAHGREARFPFLDEDVVRLISAFPVDALCDLTQERGQGDKLVLRLVARQLGLTSCAALAKRAIQFGSRIAKQSNAATCTSNRQASGQDRLEE